MKNRSTILIVILPVLACFAFLPGAQGQLSPPPDGCFPNFTTAEGCDALKSLSTGAGNTALGWRSLFLDTTGSFNTGVGAGALALNNADSNTAVGAVALLLNTTGTQNTAVGTDTLVFNDSGSSNTGTGYFALMNNTTGGSNTATGWEALTANTTGSNNTAIGNQALQSSLTTSDHVALGSGAGSGITTADNNIIIGRRCRDGRFRWKTRHGHLRWTRPGWIFGQRRHPAPGHFRRRQANHDQSDGRELGGNHRAATATNRNAHSPVERAGHANREGERPARDR